jgi:hypothetical protein
MNNYKRGWQRRKEMDRQVDEMIAHDNEQAKRIIKVCECMGKFKPEDLGLRHFKESDSWSIGSRALNFISGLAIGIVFRTHSTAEKSKKLIRLIKEALV